MQITYHKGSTSASTQRKQSVLTPQWLKREESTWEGCSLLLGPRAQPFTCRVVFKEKVAREFQKVAKARIARRREDLLEGGGGRKYTCDDPGVALRFRPRRERAIVGINLCQLGLL